MLHALESPDAVDAREQETPGIARVLQHGEPYRQKPYRARSLGETAPHRVWVQGPRGASRQNVFGESRMQEYTLMSYCRSSKPKIQIITIKGLRC